MPQAQRRSTPIPRRLNAHEATNLRKLLVVHRVCTAPMVPNTSVSHLGTVSEHLQQEIEFYTRFYEQESLLTQKLADRLIKISITKAEIKAHEHRLSSILSDLQVFDDTESENPDYIALNASYDQVFEQVNEKIAILKKQQEELGEIQFQLDTVRTHFEHPDMYVEEVQAKVTDNFSKRVGALCLKKQEEKARKEAQQKKALEEEVSARKIAQPQAGGGAAVGQAGALTQLPNNQDKTLTPAEKRYRESLKRL